MGKTLAQVIDEARAGDQVNVTLTTNEDDGITAYAEGSLVFTPASGGVVLGGRFDSDLLRCPQPAEPICGCTSVIGDSR